MIKKFNHLISFFLRNNLRTSLIACTLLISSFASAQLKVTEELVSIPTYKNDLPNPMPRFYEGKSHQGVQRRVYPYPMDDNLTNNKSDQSYHMIHVENVFVHDFLPRRLTAPIIPDGMQRMTATVTIP